MTTIPNGDYPPIEVPDNKTRVSAIGVLCKLMQPYLPQAETTQQSGTSGTPTVQILIVTPEELSARTREAQLALHGGGSSSGSNDCVVTPESSL
jgi:hypothetical protein